MNNKPFVPALCIVTGLSGAGKSTALRAFEDINFFCVDGLPAKLLPDMAKLLQGSELKNYRGIAIGMDLREHDFLDSFNSALLTLSSQNISINLIFLDAAETIIFDRYAATRRPHPLERTGTGLAGAIALERTELQSLKEMADIILDTSSYNIYDLRKAIRKLFQPSAPVIKQIKINIISFGYKYGIPKDANYVFDLRFLKNPFFIEKLRPLSGKDREIVDYIFSFPEADSFILKLCELFSFVLPNLIAEGRDRVTIALGCTGGRHRSVALAEKFAAILGKEGYDIILEHRHLDYDMVDYKE